LPSATKGILPVLSRILRCSAGILPALLLLQLPLLVAHSFVEESAFDSARAKVSCLFRRETRSARSIEAQRVRSPGFN
jgi:hypothetical protein